MNTKDVRVLNRNRKHRQYGETHPVTEDEWQDFVKMVGENAKIPDYFKAFVFRYNGGVFEENLLEGTPAGDVIPFTFSPLMGEDNVYPITMSLPYVKEEGYEYLIPFADDPGGNYFLLDVSPEGTGQVFFNNHETNEYIAISDSFEEFIEKLVFNHYEL